MRKFETRNSNDESNSKFEWRMENSCQASRICFEFQSFEFDSALLKSYVKDYREAAVLNVKRFEGDILDSI